LIINTGDDKVEPATVENEENNEENILLLLLDEDWTSNIVDAGDGVLLDNVDADDTVDNAGTDLSTVAVSIFTRLSMTQLVLNPDVIR
jgi:hypothetical protein